MAERIRYSLASQVAEAFPAAAEDFGEIAEGVSPQEHVKSLLDANEPLAATIFMALALPKRDAVWWGCLALRGMGHVDPLTQEGIRLAEAWCKNPEEDERRAAGTFAEENYFEGAGAWIAFAAFTTSGSLAPAGLQAVPPSSEVSGKSAAMAVIQATEDPGEDYFVTLANILCALASAQDFSSGGDGTQPWRDHVPGTRAPVPEDDDESGEAVA
ncbi:MAG: hypothetical protein AAF334_06845 [Pseudomonadota bacterium]